MSLLERFELEQKKPKLCLPNRQKKWNSFTRGWRSDFPSYLSKKEARGQDHGRGNPLGLPQDRQLCGLQRGVVLNPS